MKVATGVKRLDELLSGGLPERTATLVYGPPFVGKELLAKTFVLQGLRQGQPAVAVLTDASATEFRNQLAAMEPRLGEYEKAGLLQFVDAYSKTIGAVDKHPAAEYVDGLVNFNAVSLAVNNAERKLIRDHAAHRFVFESVSTLIAYTNVQTAFRFLQVLVGRTRSAGATGLLLLDQGMHTDAEVQAIKHLAQGVVEFRTEAGKNRLHVEGAGLTDTPGWVDYRFSEAAIELTGSFAAGRIR